MSRSTPAVHRAAMIIKFMADHPGQSFTLTELSAALAISGATCLGVLNALVGEGLLIRMADRHYALGPALVRVGNAAQQQLSPLLSAHPEMRRLADQYDVMCSAFTLEGHQLVVRERTSSASHAGFAANIGNAFTPQPHSVAVFFAWSSAEECDAWLSGCTPAPTPGQIAAMQLRMDFAREYGFVLIVQRAVSGMPYVLADVVYSLENRDLPLRSLDDLSGSDPFQINSIMAPVFDSVGNVAFAMGMTGFRRPQSGDAVMRIANQLKQACGRVTEYIVSQGLNGPLV